MNNFRYKREKDYKFYISFLVGYLDYCRNGSPINPVPKGFYNKFRFFLMSFKRVYDLHCLIDTLRKYLNNPINKKPALSSNHSRRKRKRRNPVNYDREALLRLLDTPWDK